VCKLPKLFYYASEAERDHRHSVSDWKTGPRTSEIDMAGYHQSISGRHC
jgi:hypothetical protein